MHKQLALASAMFLAAAAPANAQSWAYNTMNNMRNQQNVEELCLAGGYSVQTTQSQLARMREGAQQSMSSYVELTRPGVSTDVSSLYVRRGSSWTRVSDGASLNDVTAIVDPLAPNTASLNEPTQFIRAADGQTTAGLWVVTDSAGATLGYYRGVFRRAGGDWRLVSLEVGEGADIAQLTPYCHRPGDVDEYVAAQRASVIPKDETADAGGNNMEGIQPLQPRPASQ